MSNAPESWDTDIQWLADKGYRLTADQQDEFAERVAIMIVDAGIDEDIARNLVAVFIAENQIIPTEDVARNLAVEKFK